MVDFLGVKEDPKLSAGVELVLRLKAVVEGCYPPLLAGALRFVIQTGIRKKQMVSLVGHVGLYNLVRQIARTCWP
jgi:hypothetical protein